LRDGYQLRAVPGTRSGQPLEIFDIYHIKQIKISIQKPVVVALPRICPGDDTGPLSGHHQQFIRYSGREHHRFAPLDFDQATILVGQSLQYLYPRTDCETEALQKLKKI